MEAGQFFYLTSVRRVDISRIRIGGLACLGRVAWRVGNTGDLDNATGRYAVREKSAG